MHIHPLITKSGELKALVGRLSKQPFVAVDTEFMRENTYWPDLCLIQVASVDEAAAIDPKADGIDLDPLLDLFVADEDVLKVFHAGGQDLEIIHNLTGKVPHPLFDTQIAAMALGHGEQIGYSNLIESLLGHSLDKGARFTDWGRRPLDKRQIDYAIADVTHLATIFPRMVEKLRKTGRGAWLDEEMERLADASSFAFEPKDAWRRLKLPSRNATVLGRLKALAAWRETEARSKNLPRGRIVKDDTLTEIVLHPPKNQDDLGRIRGLSAGWRTNDIGARLMNAIQSARPLEADEMPDREPRRPGLTKDGALVSDLLKLLLKIRAKETGVAAKLIARTDDLEALAAGVRKNLRILDGWRYDQFGKDALDLVEGRLAFAIENGKLKMSRVVIEEKSMRKLLLFVPLAFAGCAAQQRQVVGIDQVPPGSVCTATAALNSFIGQPASAELGARMMAASRARNLRWVPFGGVVTMDFSPTRLTVRLDQQGRVKSATCG